MPTLPSPASSPKNLLESPEISSQPSRKRQRSQSMQSDSGASTSSVKRAVADIPGSDNPRTDQLSTLTLGDPNQDIDTYMEEQGEADIPAFMPPPSQVAPAMQSLPPGEKISLAENGKKRKMEIGEIWYLVSSDWYKRWIKACSGVVDKEGPLTEQELGPVDNSSLLDSYNNLLASLAEGVEVEYVPEEVWSHFVLWYVALQFCASCINFQARRYGPPIHPLPRRVIARGAAKQATIELRPLRLKVFRLVKAYVDRESTPHPYLTISAGETISTLCSQLAAAVSPDGQSSSPYRIWSLPSDDSTRTEFLGSQLPLSDARIIEESEQTLEEKELESDDAFVVEFKQSDGWIAEVPKAAPLAIEPPPVFHSTDGFFNKMSSTRSSTSSMVPYKSALYNAFSITSSSSRSSSTAVTLPGKGISKAMDPGTLGLGNMLVQRCRVSVKLNSN
jgi:ubiquitin carboxyl-terminal hydrolase 4/11/15